MRNTSSDQGSNRNGEGATRRLARAACECDVDSLSGPLVAKVKVCLRDLIGCACESYALPWAEQARAAVPLGDGGVSVIGHDRGAGPADAAFVNAVMGHGLVREDMHAGSISHLGIVVLPVVLALAGEKRVSGRDLIAAIVVGYETGGQLGRALMDAEVARVHRPTGVVGPLAGTAAGARLCGVDEEVCLSALALATNAVAGFNQWAWTGGSEMFFEAGAAARSAVTAVKLAGAGAFGSPDAIEGPAGLCAALGKAAAGARMLPFVAEPEILSVYHKAVPACNFAQTPALAALSIAQEQPLESADIAEIIVRVPRAGALYPGCDAQGPYRNVLQGKMSIQFNVATALTRGVLNEENFALLDDPGIARLVALTRLEIDEVMTTAYPGQQGGAVEVRLSDGSSRQARLADVIHAGDSQVTERFEEAIAQRFGRSRAGEIAAALDTLENLDDAGELIRLLRLG